MSTRRIPPELADGRTFYDFTFQLRDCRYASKAETRAAILRELRKYRLVEGLGTTAQRVAITDRVLVDDAWLRKHAGSVIAAVARDVFDAWLGGRWRDESGILAECQAQVGVENLMGTCPCSESGTDDGG